MMSRVVEAADELSAAEFWNLGYQRYVLKTGRACQCKARDAKRIQEVYMDVCSILLDEHRSIGCCRR
jgi:hypothetical protein